MKLMNDNMADHRLQYRPRRRHVGRHDLVPGEVRCGYLQRGGHVEREVGEDEQQVHMEEEMKMVLPAAGWARPAERPQRPEAR